LLKRVMDPAARWDNAVMAQPTNTVRPVVLVVDDDADVRDTTAHLLSTRGMQTRTAADTASALELLEQCAGQVGVVVADLSMPGEAPGALTRAITAADSHIRIVYATGIPRHVAVSTGLVRPDAPYLEKPVDPDTLAGLVRSLTTRRISA
jgi:DNA-binding NtrC family response regulator